MTDKKKNPWYISGLHFECSQCGQCCSGPGEGYIWLNRKEIAFIADFLKISEDKLRQKYIKRVGLRTSIIEERMSKDCIFAQNIGGKKGCLIYPVRPNQCRTWPFWQENINTPDGWNQAACTCPGINRGKLYSVKEIEKISKQKKWWDDDK